MFDPSLMDPKTERKLTPQRRYPRGTKPSKVRGQFYEIEGVVRLVEKAFAAKRWRSRKSAEDDFSYFASLQAAVNFATKKKFKAVTPPVQAVDFCPDVGEVAEVAEVADVGDVADVAKVPDWLLADEQLDGRFSVTPMTEGPKVTTAAVRRFVLGTNGPFVSRVAFYFQPPRGERKRVRTPSPASPSKLRNPAKLPKLPKRIPKEVFALPPLPLDDALACGGVRTEPLIPIKRPRGRPRKHRIATFYFEDDELDLASYADLFEASFDLM